MMADTIQLKGRVSLFLANSYAHPESLRSVVTQARQQQLTRQEESAIKKLEARGNKTLMTRGFERQAESQFFLDCPS